ncbi:hypothetical protein WDW37_19455, partial [Bdellovibrionota bacterium FG-1]
GGGPNKAAQKARGGRVLGGGCLGAKAGGGGGTEINFAAVKKVSVTGPESDDIWHEGFGGTIFQIVSTKLVKNQDRIENLEWDTPLNRALVGLPSRSQKAGGK